MCHSLSFLLRLLTRSPIGGAVICCGVCQRSQTKMFDPLTFFGISDYNMLGAFHRNDQSHIAAALARGEDF